MFARGMILTVLAVAGSMVSASAQTTTFIATRTISLPPAGIGSTETMQVTLTNLAANPSSGPAASCTGNVLFLNSSGATIGTATPFSVGAGQSFPVKLPFASATATGTRVDVRAVLMTTQTAGTPCTLTYSLETYDTATGATHLYLANTPVSQSVLPGLPIPIIFER